jgi:hypothetical protein
MYAILCVDSSCGETALIAKVVGPGIVAVEANIEPRNTLVQALHACRVTSARGTGLLFKIALGNGASSSHNIQLNVPQYVCTARLHVQCRATHCAGPAPRPDGLIFYPRVVLASCLPGI